MSISDYPIFNILLSHKNAAAYLCDFFLFHFYIDKFTHLNLIW